MVLQLATFCSLCFIRVVNCASVLIACFVESIRSNLHRLLSLIYLSRIVFFQTLQRDAVIFYVMMMMMMIYFLYSATSNYALSALQLLKHNLTMYENR